MPTETTIRLSELQMQCLISLRASSRPDGERCVPFSVIAGDTELGRAEVRRSVRALARKGLAEFHSGLTTEDGDFAGSGYCISTAGLEQIGKAAS